LSGVTPRHDIAPFYTAPVSKHTARTAISAALDGTNKIEIKLSRSFSPLGDKEPRPHRPRAFVGRHAYRLPETMSVGTLIPLAFSFGLPEIVTGIARINDSACQFCRKK